MKKILPLVAAAALVVAGAGCNANTNYAPTAGGTGRVVFAIKDASKDLAGVTSVMVTVAKVEAHSETDGWIVASATAKQYDLVKLKATGAAELLADANLAAGTYDQVRLTISKVEATANGKVVSVKLPSNVLKIVGRVTVVSGETTTVTFDVDLDRSIHLTSAGQYILAPVVKLEVRDSADVTVKEDESVEIEDGEVETDVEVGADETGETHEDFELPESLHIDTRGRITTEVK